MNSLHTVIGAVLAFLFDDMHGADTRSLRQHYTPPRAEHPLEFAAGIVLAVLIAGGLVYSLLQPFGAVW